MNSIYNFYTRRMRMKKTVICLLINLSLLMATQALAQEKEVAVTPKAPLENKISLDIKGMDIVDVFKMLAMRSGMNIAVGKNVTGKVVLFLKDVDVRDAFEILILANDLAYDKKGDIINIMTQRDYELLYGQRYQDKKEARVISLKYAKAADLSRALIQIKTNIGKIVPDEASNTLVLIDTPDKLMEMEDFIKKTDLPTQTRIFNLSYAQADKIQSKIQEAITKGLGSIKTDERTNKVAVTDYPEKLDEIAKIISAFDEKTGQVLIDAQVIEIKPTDKFEMGVDWNYWIRKHFEVRSSLPIGTTDRLLLGTLSAATPAEKGEYKTILDLLRTIGDTNILSSPRIIALNNQEAKILVGTKDAYITSTTSQGGTGTTVTSQSVNFVDVGIKLYVTPTVNRDGFVTMKIRPEISSSQRVTIKSEDKETQIPIVSTSEAETTVMVKDGITVIIGGLRKDERSKIVKKIPIIGDIPLLGFFFRSTSDELKKTDLVILLTPHIISGESAYTDFSEIRPTEGAVAKMVKGDIVMEKISASKPDESKPAEAEPKTTELKPAEKNTGYYELVSNKIRQFAKLNSPVDKKGKVGLQFRISSNGNLIGEPRVIKTSDDSLTPYALKAIKEASPFPLFPKDFKKEETGFNISIDYK